MRSGEIRFAASVDHDGDWMFEVIVSKDTQESRTHFYGYADTWQGFGTRLVAFPRGIKEHVVFEAGQRHSNFVGGSTTLMSLQEGLETCPHRRPSDAQERAGAERQAALPL